MEESALSLDCSVVLSTHNRCGMLAGALADLTAQQHGTAAIEVIVVDNASTDGTAAVVQATMARCPWVRYLYEPTRGPGAGRNAGIAIARGRIIAFTDDDNRIAPDWVTELLKAFAAHPEADVVAGRILPSWLAQAPAWLTRDHWVGPLALQDYGDSEFIIDAARPIALSTANLAIRRQALDQIGWFDPQLQRAEDTELLVRFWRAGGRCLYAPRALVAAEVQPERMTKQYHAWWHNANGSWTAAFDLAELIHRDGSLRQRSTDTVRLWGVPAFIIRELLSVARHWALAALIRSPRALAYEHRLRFLSGYIDGRFRQYRAAHRVRSLDVLTFGRALLRKKLREFTSGAAASAPDAPDADTASRTQSPNAPTRSSVSFHSPAVVAIGSGDRDRPAALGSTPPTAHQGGTR